MAEKLWHFAIDVGGTFTDCIGHCVATSETPSQTVRHKLLSSGITTGRIANVASSSSASSFCDPRRTGDPADFWRDFAVAFKDETGSVLGLSRIAQFESETGTFVCSESVPKSATTYELTCDLPAPVIAIRYLLGLPLSKNLPSIDVRLGTTRGTNALLTRSGATTAFVTTSGFGDILYIRDQQRPKLFELNIRKPTPLFDHVIEVDERVAADGEVLTQLDVNRALRDFQAAKESGVQSIAICLLHGYAFPEHEQELAKIAAEVGFQDISVSHQVAPMMKIVPRGDTTVVNAYLNPVLQAYRRKIEAAIGNNSRVQWMTSAGGLVSGSDFCGKESVLSGPAGGVVGFSRTASTAGYDCTIGFDMGGTSTDVARYDGDFSRVYETQKAGIHLTTPMLEIETVAAGGGSICDFDGVQITVGPDSAGADPGPMCYGRGGPLTITDMNLFLGRIQPDRFPFPVAADEVAAALTEMCATIKTETGTNYTPESLASGMIRLANAKMARAIQSISTARGYDPREHALVSFGGAAPQHACAVARELGIRTIINHPDGGILSAVGIGMAPIMHHAERSLYSRLSECLTSLTTLSQNVESELLARFTGNENNKERIEIQHSLSLRYVGQDAAFSVSLHPFENVAQRFHDAHRHRYGYDHTDREIEVVALQSIATLHDHSKTPSFAPTKTDASPANTSTVTFDDQPLLTSIYDRSTLPVGATIDGPAILSESLSTTLIDPGWQARVLDDGQILIQDQRVEQDGPSKNTDQSNSAEPFDPVSLEVFANAFAGIADQMGQTLRNASTSVNVKERLDFSCAIFDSHGNLVVNAPHIPVHLGAMSETIRHLIADHPDMRLGDVFITNDPFRGGSHLPDVTVITPVFDASSGQRNFFTASRAHHAEIGGIVPGSMPPFSKCLAEEGVLIPSQHVVAAGQSRLDEIKRLLTSAPHPTRDVASNLADITAQIAANQQGATRLHELTAQHGTQSMLTATQQLQDVAETKTRRALKKLGDGSLTFADRLDDGSKICVAIDVQDGAAIIDFTGSADIHPENLNANRGIVQAATIYALRCLINEELPINEGMLRPVTFQLPTGILNPPDLGDPEKNAAMVGGNVETSQRIVDVLLGAMGLAAASQGTMNNLLFGDDTFGYYETICGGAGATPDAPGASAVHTHMTNTRMTDPEVFESRFPVRLHAFKIRHGSGGEGQHRGGDGIIRRIEFLAALEVSLLTQRRDTAPYGLGGGAAGASGKNRLSRANGGKNTNATNEELPGRIQFQVQPGDILTLETPGGGGAGSAAPRHRVKGLSSAAIADSSSPIRPPQNSK